MAGQAAEGVRKKNQRGIAMLVVLHVIILYH